jgi:hypothetical protein
MLPRIDVPTYDLTLPITKEKVKYRPFLVKEQKLFLIASEAKEMKDVINTIKQVVKNCIVEPKNYDVDHMSILDLEYMFIHLRARSMGENVELEFSCNNIVDEKVCNGKSKMVLNLLKAHLVEDPEHKNIISFTPTIGVKMKYPNFEISQKLMRDMQSKADVFDGLVECIEYIYDGDTLIYPKDQKREELIEWFDALSNEHLEQLYTFVKTSPKIIAETKFHCAKCGYEEDVTLEGIQSFFG